MSEVPRLTIEDIRQKIILKDFKIKYAEAINLEDPSDYDYMWLSAVSGKQTLMHVSVPFFGNVRLTVEDGEEK